MSEQVLINVDAEIYNRLTQLMVPPIDDVNAVIRELLFHDGHDSRAVVALQAAERHFTMEEELQRASAGVLEGTCS